jgi:predicted MFS family arabinose efflux permease
MPIAGRFVDRHGPIRCGVGALLISSPLVVGFGLTRSLLAIAGLGAVVALAYSVVYTAGQAAVAGGTIPRGLAGAGQGAYEATYAIGAMTCSFIAPLLYDRNSAFLMWAVAGTTTVLFGLGTWFTASGSRAEIVHMDDLHEPPTGPVSDATMRS